MRTHLSEHEMNPSNVFIIDGIVSTMRSNEKHYSLLREVMRMPSTKVVEHPDIFVRESEYTYDDFDVIVELRHTPDEEINYDQLTNSFEEM